MKQVSWAERNYTLKYLAVCKHQLTSEYVWFV